MATVAKNTTVPVGATVPYGAMRCADNVIVFPGAGAVATSGDTVYEEEVFPIKKPEEIQAMGKWLRENAGAKYFVAFVLGINLGLRANELLALTWGDVLDDGGTIRYSADVEDVSDRISVYQSKTGKTRRLYLNSACVEVLTWYRQQNTSVRPSEPLFPSRKGGGILTVDALRKVLKRAAAACGIKQNIGTHTLRKTFGYFQYTQHPENLHLLQQMFGHSSESITLRYIGIMEENRKAAYNTVELRAW